jgi:hypothetical protein
MATTAIVEAATITEPLYSRAAVARNPILVAGKRL